VVAVVVAVVLVKIVNMTKGKSNKGGAKMQKCKNAKMQKEKKGENI